MMNKKLLLIYNSTAGRGTVSSSLFKGIEYLTAKGYEVTVFPVSPADHLYSEDIIKDTKGRFDVIMVCGGDGTLNHAVDGMIKAEVDLPLAYVPVGSTNDFSKSLYGENSADVMSICHYITDGELFRYDVGRFNDRHFNYVAAFGAFPQVSYTTPQEMKNNLGHAAYILKLLSMIPDGLSYSTHARVKHDGVVEEGDYMIGFITNSISVGGVQPGVIKQSSLDDGMFEVTLVKSNMNPLEWPDALMAMNDDHHHSDVIMTFRTDAVEFEFDQDVPWTLDGEDGGTGAHADVSVVDKAIEIFVPKQ